ncbi:hypothetical protein D3C87_1494840 [compost metagenome]
MAERIALTCSGKLFQRCHFQGRQAQPIEITWRARLVQVDLRKITEQSLRFAQMPGAARHRRHRLWPALAQHREHLMTQVVARVLSILIGRVLDPAQMIFAGIGFQFGPCDIEQWPQ